MKIAHYKIGTGITYANLNDISMARQFLRTLQQKDYEKAYEYLKIQEHYEGLINETYPNTEEEDGSFSIVDGIQKVRNNGFEWYDKACKEKFIENMRVLEESGFIIDSYSYQEVYKQNAEWDVLFVVEAEKGTTFNLQITLNNDGISRLSPTKYVNDYTEVNSGLEMLDYLSDYYIMPTLNEPVIGTLYEGSDFDWTVLFDHEY